MQGVLNSLNGATITNASVLDGLNLKQAQLLLTTKGLSAEKQKELLVNAGLMASEDKVTLTLMKQAFMSSSLGDEEKERALIKLGLIDRNTKEAISEAVCTKKDIEALVAQGLLNEEQKEGILAILGLDTANKSASVSLGLFTKGIWANIKAMATWMISNPLGWIILLGGTIAATVGLVDLFTTSVEEHREKLESLKSEYSDVKSELDGLKGELDGTQSRINELESKGKLTFTEAEELNNLRKQNNELQRSIDLLELQNKTKKKELNDQFVETMNSDIEQELYTRNENDEVVQYMPMSGQTATDDNEADYINQRFKDLQKLRDELASASTEAEKERINRQIKGIEDYFIQKNKDFTETAEGIDYIQNPTTKDDEKVNEWLDYINDFQDKMAIAMGGDNAKENAFNRLVDNWKFDELLNPLQKLGKEGKVTFDMLTDSAGKVLPKYRDFIDNLIKIGFISDDTEGSLRFVASAFNGTMQSARNYVAVLKGNDLNNFIDNLGEEAKALGTTESELAKLTAAHILFNKTNINTNDKATAFMNLATAIGKTSSEIAYLLKLFNAASKGENAVFTWGAKEINGAPKTKVPKGIDVSVDPKKILEERYGISPGIFEIPEKEDVNLYHPTGGGDKGSSKDNKPDYEDSTEAVINRINLRSKELEQQEEQIENAIEIAELENDYKKQISLTSDKLDVQRQKVDALKTANSELHQMAEDLRNSTPDWNEEEWFDSQGNETKAYIDFINGRIDAGASKEEIESIKDQFEKISKIKEAWIKNDEEIIDLNKQILQEEENIWDIRREIFDARMEESEYYIQHSKDFGWENGDNEIKARKRVLEWIQSDYYKSLIKDDIEYYKILEENRLKYNEALKEEFDKSTDLGSSYYDSKKTLLQSYFDVTNSIAEAQHEINKELEASKTMYEHLNEDTRKLLFNQEDYNTLSKELIDIQSEADRLKRQYEYDLDNATLDTVEKITSQYEMQYETLMKSYEIAKADLEIAKKKQKLDNVLNEKNVKMRINGQWQWVAKTQDVIDAQSELADAEYAKRVAESGLTQQKSIDDLTKKQNQLGTIISKFSNGVISLDDAIGNIVSRFRDLPDNILNSLRGISTTSASSSSSSSGTYYSYSGRTLQVNSDGTAPKGAQNGDIIQTAGGDYLIVPAGSKGATYNSNSGYYSIKIKERHANGTRYTPGGLTALGEVKDEMFISNNGHLIPINQPTIGNIGAGGIVFNQDQMDFTRKIWDWSNTGVIPTANIPNIANRQMSETNTYQMFGNMIFDGNNPEEIFKMLADFLKNTRYKSN